MILLLLIIFMALVCPKCGGHSWIEIEADDTPVQRCVCGLTKWLKRECDGSLITRSPIRNKQVSLPARGTQLSKILGCLITLGNMNSRQIAKSLQISVDKATTNLSVLRRRGLVEVLEDRKGRIGGSVWSVFAPVIAKFTGDK